MFTVIGKTLWIGRQPRDDFQVYARTVPMSVKAGAVEAFTELIESEIIPLVRHLKGFQDALFHKIGTRVSL